jgi:hypothetical protein
MRISHYFVRLILRTALLSIALLLVTPLYVPAQQTSGIPRYTMTEQSSRQTPKSPINSIVRGIDIVPYIVAEEDSLQSYIQDNAISVWVNIPSLQRNGDTLTAVVKRVIRYDITHTLTSNLVAVDVIRFNTRNDTFARVASMDKSTNVLAAQTKQEWEKTSLDLDMTALYHYVGYLYDNKQKK